MSTATITSTRRDPAEHKKFWADTLGGTVIKVGATDGREIIRMPNVLHLHARAGGEGRARKGAPHDHIGLSVPNLRATLAKVTANGFRIITAQESPAGSEGERRHRRAGTGPGSAGWRYVLGSRRREGRIA